MRTQPVDPLFYKIATVAKLLGLGHSMVYRLVKAGTLRAVRIGGAIRIPRESLDEYLAGLPNVVDAHDEETEQTPLLTR